MKATLVDTVTEFKDLLFKAEERGFNTEGIAPDFVFIAFWDADDTDTKVYRDTIKFFNFDSEPTDGYFNGYL